MRAQATHATGQRIMSASRTDLQKLDMFGKVESPSGLNSRCPLNAFVVGESTGVCGIHAYKSTQLVLSFDPGTRPPCRVALTTVSPSQPDTDCYCTVRCHSRPNKPSLQPYLYDITRR